MNNPIKIFVLNNPIKIFTPIAFPMRDGGLALPGQDSGARARERTELNDGCTGRTQSSSVDNQQSQGVDVDLSLAKALNLTLSCCFSCNMSVM